MILDTSSRDMRYTIKAIDSILDYDGDLMSQMQHLEAFTDMDSSRITLIRTDGTVITDSDADAEYLDNHLGREEIRKAVEEGEAFVAEAVRLFRIMKPFNDYLNRALVGFRMPER